MRFLLSIFVTFGALAGADQVAPFDVNVYRQECGGTIFPHCGAWFHGSDQRTIFDHAVNWARQENKLVIAITGFDWCPPCRHDLQQFTSADHGASPEVLAEIENRFVVAPVDRDYHGSTSVLTELGLDSYGFSEVVIFDPQTRKSIQRITWPQLLAGMHTKKCEETPVGNKTFRFADFDYGFDAKLQILRDPATPIQDFIKAHDAAVEASCKSDEL